MKRQVFFSFYFGNDVWRVGQIRNIGTIEGQELFSDNGWEKVRLKNDSAIKAWIDKELDMRSCVVVLIGSETASRRWVQYEIEQAWKRGKGIVGVYINKLKNSNSKYFEIPDKEIVKKGSGFYNIGIYFTKYQRKEHKQYIHMVIYEADGYGKEGRNIILEESIEMKSWIYE